MCTWGADIERVVAAASAAASSVTSRRPFHATSVPPSRRRGAAYSRSTGSDASARAVTTSCSPSPAAQASARDATITTLSRPVPRPPVRGTRPSSGRSRPARRAHAGKRNREDQPREPCTRPEIGDRSRLTKLGDLQAGKRVGDVDVHGARRFPDGRQRHRLGRDEIHQARQPAGRVAGEGEAPAQRVDAIGDGGHALSVPRETPVCAQRDQPAGRRLTVVRVSRAPSSPSHETTAERRSTPRDRLDRSVPTELHVAALPLGTMSSDNVVPRARIRQDVACSRVPLTVRRTRTRRDGARVVARHLQRDHRGARAIRRRHAATA